MSYTTTDVIKKKTPYRILEDYETIRADDRALFKGEEWNERPSSTFRDSYYLGRCASEYNQEDVQACRAIREVSVLPGWRFLDVKEKARIGDQTAGGRLARKIEDDPMIRDYEPAETPDDEPRAETKTIYIRQLNPHEVIRKGDRFGRKVGSFDQMMLVGFSIGDTAKSSNVWREVRLRTPLTRWLDANEIVSVNRDHETWTALGSGAQAVKVPIDFPSVNDAFNGFIPVPDEKIERRPTPKRIECGCGKHSYSEGTDPYAAHRIYMNHSDREDCDRSNVGPLQGVGVSDRPVISVLADDMSGEDIAADAPTAEDYLTRSQLVI